MDHGVLDSYGCGSLWGHDRAAAVMAAGPWQTVPSFVLACGQAGSYSFRDVLALRAFAILRQDVSLQKIRKALATLKRFGEVEHLSSYSLVAEGDSIVLVRDGTDDHATDLRQASRAAGDRHHG